MSVIGQAFQKQSSKEFSIKRVGLPEHRTEQRKAEVNVVNFWFLSFKQEKGKEVRKREREERREERRKGGKKERREEGREGRKEERRKKSDRLSS
jgi:hypothetical protein